MTDVVLPEAFESLFTPARYKAFHGGRGSAKSHSFATALLILGGQRKLRILCGREVQKSIRESAKQLLDDKIQAMGLGGFYQSLQNEIRGANGTQFGFVGLGKLTVDQIKSYEGVDIFWGEEAQAFSAYSLETLIPTIRKPGSELWFSWNPRHASDPVDRRFRGEAVPEDSIVRKVNYNDNPFFPEDLEKERVHDYVHNKLRYPHIWLGEYEPMAVGAIWDRLVLHECRVDEAPALRRVVVAVDPATQDPETADPISQAGNEHGLIVVAEGMDGHGYVLDDFSGMGTPNEWGRRVVAAAIHYDADAIVAEVNQGGAMVTNTIKAVMPPGKKIPIVGVHAAKGKVVRAEPISALYPLGKIHHVGSLPQLEDQMCLMTHHGYDGRGSPDRVDALVWGLSYLFPSISRNIKPRKGILPSAANRGGHRPIRGMR